MPLPSLSADQLKKLAAFKETPPPAPKKRRKGGALTLALLAAAYAEGLRRITPWGLYQRIVAVGEVGKWPKVHSQDGWTKVCGDLLGLHYADLPVLEEVPGEGTARQIPDDFDVAKWIEVKNLDTSL